MNVMHVKNDNHYKIVIIYFLEKDKRICTRKKQEDNVDDIS